MNRRRNGGFLPPVKQYVNAIERRLHLPLREKARIMSDISTSIAARHEAGESYEAVMADMGPPDAVAAPFNWAFAGQYKGSAWRFLWLGLALAVLVAAAAALVFTAGMAAGVEMAFLPQSLPWVGTASAGIIGGADGPTAVFVTSFPGAFSMGPLDALVTAGALLALYFLCRAQGTNGARHLRTARTLAGACATVFCIRFFLAMAVLSLAEGSPASLARMFLSPGFLLTAAALGLVIWRTPQKPKAGTEEEKYE